MNTMGTAMAASPQMAAAEEAKAAAYELILGQGRDVFDLSKEKPELRDRYGRNTFGQECLVARRLVETGVPYVVINYPGGWDTHSNHFATMRRQCPQLDQGLAALLAGPARPRPAGEHDRLVQRRVRPQPEGGLAAALERRPQPLRQRVHRSWWPAAGSRAAAWSALRTRRPRRSRSGPSTRSTCWAASINWRASTPAARLPHPMGIEAHVLPVGRRTREVGRTVDGDHVEYEVALSFSRRACPACAEAKSRVMFHGGQARRLIKDGAAHEQIAACGFGTGWAAGRRPRRRRRPGRTSGSSIPPAASRARRSASGSAGRGWTASTAAIVSGPGVSAKVVEYHRRLNNQEMTLMRDQVAELKRAAAPAEQTAAKIASAVGRCRVRGDDDGRRRRDDGLAGGTGKPSAAGTSDSASQMIARIQERLAEWTIGRPATRSPAW